jgi:tetratricopeptide (TPR) repeat protein
MLVRFCIRMRLFLFVVLAATLLVTTSGSADQSEADLVKQGTDALKHRDYNVAIALFSQAIRLNPEDAEAVGKRGEAYAAEGEKDAAQSDCAQGIKLAPASSAAHYRCGYVYLRSNQLERAIEAFNAAITLDPRNASAYAARGLANAKHQNLDDAISDCGKSIQLDPSQSDVYVLRGNVLLRKGEFDRAWDDYNRAIQVDPRNAHAYVNRGYVAASRYAFDEAIADYDKAISIDPTYKEAIQYRDDALRLKSNEGWGTAYLVLMGLGALALLFASVWAYNSPTAFSHSVDRHFRRVPDGRLVYYPTIKGVGYVVPDAQRETGLRLFCKHHQSLAIAFGVLGPVLMFGLTIPFMGALRMLQSRIGISTSAAVLISSFGSVVLILAAGLFGFSRQRRNAVRGLAKAEEKGEGRRFDQWIDDFSKDMPVAVRWIAFALLLFITYKSLTGLWQVLSGSPVPRMVGIPSWLFVGVDLMVLWYCGKLLFQLARHRYGGARPPGGRA